MYMPRLGMPVGPIYQEHTIKGIRAWRLTYAHKSEMGRSLALAFVDGMNTMAGFYVENYSMWKLETHDGWFWAVEVSSLHLVEEDFPEAEEPEATLDTMF